MPDADRTQEQGLVWVSTLLAEMTSGSSRQGHSDSGVAQLMRLARDPLLLHQHLIAGDLPESHSQRQRIHLFHMADWAGSLPLGASGEAPRDRPDAQDTNGLAADHSSIRPEAFVASVEDIAIAFEGGDDGQDCHRRASGSLERHTAAAAFGWYLTGALFLLTSVVAGSAISGWPS